MAILGIVPSNLKTFEVMGSFNETKIDGRLYHDDKGRLYMYSLRETRSNPSTGYFPIWDGHKTIITKYSNEKYVNTDMTKFEVEEISKVIDKDTANQILYKHRRSSNDKVLQPVPTNDDNMFTQCIKGVLNARQLTIVDLVDMSKPKLDEEVIANYYSALTKISFMRLDKWNIWVDAILHLQYELSVFKDDKKQLTFYHPQNKFDTGVVNYSAIIDSEDDALKKIISILIIKNNINKDSLRSDTVSDYTINNMLTTLTKPKLSSQIFSRFIRMAGLNYTIKISDMDGTKLFEYAES